MPSSVKRLKTQNLTPFIPAFTTYSVAGVVSSDKEMSDAKHGHELYEKCLRLHRLLPVQTFRS